MSVLWIVIPAYNEEILIKESGAKLKLVLDDLIERGKISSDSKIVFVDDGSNDKTWELISELNAENKMFSGIKLVRNYGHQMAMLAGLVAANGIADATISIDADLQDDINVIEQFVDNFINGCDIVYGVRKSRDIDSFAKRFFAESFYKLMRFMGINLVYNHADYRLLSNRALQALLNYEETNLFIRGLIPQLGYKSCIVEYDRLERLGGEPKYSFFKSFELALDGITSLSIKPVRFVFALGIIFTLISFLILFTGKLGLFSIWFIGGLQLASIGLIGEYIGKTYIETKKRPRYVVEKSI